MHFVTLTTRCHNNSLKASTGVATGVRMDGIMDGWMDGWIDDR